MTQDPLQEAVRTLTQGGIIAYPTEAVYGLGCDPTNLNAVRQLISIKQRSVDKGFILIAGEYDQLIPYIEAQPPIIKQKIVKRSSTPTTWLVKAKPNLSPYLCGKHTKVAIRITHHPLAKALCLAFGGALVSTSANKAGQPPVLSASDVKALFHDKVDYILEGEVGSLNRPTPIIDADTGKVIRN